MPAELTALALSGLLQGLQFIAFSVTANRQVGPAYAMGPRDTPRQLTGLAGRLQRALANHFEALILFTLAVVVVTFVKITSPFTAACAWTYLVARVLYIPAYVFGLSPWRSLIWGLGFLATMAMIIAAMV